MVVSEEDLQRMITKGIADYEAMKEKEKESIFTKEEMKNMSDTDINSNWDKVQRSLKAIAEEQKRIDKEKEENFYKNGEDQ